MAQSSRFNRRVALPFMLAAILAGEVTGLALAVHSQPHPSGQASAIEPSQVSRGLGSVDSRDRATDAITAQRDAANVATTRAASIEPRIRALPRSAAVARPAAASPARTTSTTTSSTARNARPTAAPAPTPARHVYSGRNHVWIPALGINRSISSFACTRSRPPDNHVYRWGCAGSNNVYLLGHAYSVFKPIHDAYVGGRLRKGMKVFYADGSGNVRTYAVTWWKVTRPTASASWAWAAQSRPSMTLQTCLGARSELRLIVRLVAVD
jgi:hypothetical protein